MEEKAKTSKKRHSPGRTEPGQKAKDDPELAVQIETAKRAMEENGDVLQRLADS